MHTEQSLLLVLFMAVTVEEMCVRVRVPASVTSGDPQQDSPPSYSVIRGPVCWLSGPVCLQESLNPVN